MLLPRCLFEYRLNLYLVDFYSGVQPRCERIKRCLQCTWT